MPVRHARPPAPARARPEEFRMHLFRLDASIIPGTSTSSELAGTAEAAWAAAHPEGTVTRRNLGTDPLPGDAWTHATLGAFTPEDQRSAEQRAAVALGAELAEELRSADAAIIAVPLYNWGVSQHFKTWVDLVIAGSRPDRRTAQGQAGRAGHLARRRLRPRHPARGLGPLHPVPGAHPARRLGRRPDHRPPRTDPGPGQPGDGVAARPRRRVPHPGPGGRRRGRQGPGRG